MDLTFTDEQLAFRDELRDWLDANPPGDAPERRGRQLRAGARDWQRRLNEGGWAGVHWPKEYGGRGASLMETAIFFEELGRAGAPLPANVLGLLLAGPTLMVWGTDEQKERYLAADPLAPRRSGARASPSPTPARTSPALKTRAVKDGDDWVVTGQKVWTSGAQYSKWCMLVARTDQRRAQAQGPHLLPDGHGAGRRSRSRPLAQITGEPEFNELFIEEARIPDENVVGGVGNGWKVALTTLMNERAGPRLLPAGPPAPAARRALRRGRRDGRARRPAGRRHARRPAHAHRDPAPDRLPRPERDRAVRPARARRARWSSGCGRRPTSCSPSSPPTSSAPDALTAGTPLVLRAAARARQLDRGRHDRDPQEHRRRAGARPAAGALGGLQMRFTLSEDQQEIKRTAHDLLASRATMASRCARPPRRAPTTTRSWRELGELGWPGIAVSEEHGGQGLGIVELCVLLEELGYACAAVPFLGSALAALAIEHAGSAEQQRALAARARLRRGCAARSARAGAADPRRARRRRRRRRRRPTAPRTSPRAAVEEVDAIDPTRRHGRVSAAAASRSTATSQAPLDRALVAVAAELVGVCQRALDMTVEYVKERKQFGVPVGTFQAVQHAAAQMLLDTEGGALRRPTTRPGPPTPSRSGCRWPRRWPRRGRRDARPRRRPPRRSSCTAASASPGRPTCTGCSSARSSTPRFLGGGGAHRAAVASLLRASVEASEAVTSAPEAVA